MSKHWHKRKHFNHFCKVRFILQLFLWPWNCLTVKPRQQTLCLCAQRWGTCLSLLFKQAFLCAPLVKPMQGHFVGLVLWFIYTGLIADLWQVPVNSNTFSALPAPLHKYCLCVTVDPRFRLSSQFSPRYSNAWVLLDQSISGLSTGQINIYNENL